MITELDNKLKNIANTDWEAFTAIVGSDAIMAAKICILRSEGKSYSQISIKLKITEAQARYAWYKFNGK